MNTKVTISNRPQVLTVSSAGVSTLGSLTDVNTTGATDGAILQYDAISASWKAENVVEKAGRTITGGNF